MISKLDPIKSFDCGDTPQANMRHHSYHNDCINKINELVDAINRHEDIIRQIGEWGSSKNECLWCENITKATLNDPYAKQRRWIGCLVEYKLGDMFLYGILTDIRVGYNPPFVIDGTSYTDDCWLPDESVIYHKPKGGDNE